MADVDLMAEVSAYNEVDCRVMMEVVGLLHSEWTKARGRTKSHCSSVMAFPSAR